MAIAKKGLAAYLEASKAPDPLFGDIQRHVLMKASEQSDRRVDCIHPSEAVKDDWCIRANYYRIVTNVVHDPRQTSFRLENIFQEGHNSHSKWQRWLTEMRKLEGYWRCDACNCFWYELGPENCSQCGSLNFRYEELPLNCESLRISGRTDGYVPSENMLIEIKTMSLGGLKWDQKDFVEPYEKYMNGKTWVALDNLWRDFRRPLKSARRQGQLYLWLARQQGLSVEKILFIYDFKANQEAKSFLIQYQPNVIEDILENCERISAAIHDGEPPACNVDESDEGHGCAACRPYEDGIQVREDNEDA